MKTVKKQNMSEYKSLSNKEKRQIRKAKRRLEVQDRILYRGPLRVPVVFQDTIARMAIVKSKVNNQRKYIGICNGWSVSLIDNTIFQFMIDTKVVIDPRGIENNNLSPLYQCEVIGTKNNQYRLHIWKSIILSDREPAILWVG